MKANLTRLERLERLSQPGEENPFLSMSAEELLSRFETVFGLAPGALPKTEEELSARGFESYAEAMASALEMTYEEFAALIDGKRANALSMRGNS